MSRRDYYDDPSAPSPNSMVPAVVMFCQDSAGRVLLIHRADSRLWALPGGAVDLGETVSAAAVRETVEESGIVAEPIGLVGVYSDPRHLIAYDDGEVRQQFSICLRGRYVSGRPTPAAPETDAVEWVAPADLDEREIHPTMRQRIAHGLAGGAPHID